MGYELEKQTKWKWNTHVDPAKCDFILYRRIKKTHFYFIQLCCDGNESNQKWAVILCKTDFYTLEKEDKEGKKDC